MADKDYAKMNTPLIVTIGIVTTILVFGVIVPGVRALLYYMEDAYDYEHRVTVVDKELDAHRKDSTNKLSHYRVVTPESGIAAIPIERAMELYVEQQKKQP